jgi:hypothetical protein
MPANYLGLTHTLDQEQHCIGHGAEIIGGADDLKVGIMWERIFLYAENG